MELLGGPTLRFHARKKDLVFQDQAADAADNEHSGCGIQ